MKCVDKYCVDQLVKSEEHWEVRGGWHKQTRQPLYIVVFALAHLEANPLLNQKVFNDMHIVEALPSPAILKRVNYVKTANNMYHVYEHLAEGSLRDYLLKKICLAEAEAAEKLRQVAQCVDALHCNNTLHRNLRTSFFMVKDGELRLTGLLNAIQPGAMDNDEVIDGREAYRAPESLRQPFDKKADIYSVGAIFCEMLFGAPPARQSVAELLRRERAVSPQTASLLQALLAPTPAARPSCREVLQLLDASPRPMRARRAPGSAGSSLQNFRERLDFLAALGDELSGKWQGLETGVYLLYSVLKKSSRVVTAYKNFLQSEPSGAAADPEQQQAELCVRQLERECMSALIKMQNCLQKQVKETLPEELARDLEELRELDWSVLKTLIVEPFLQHIEGVEGADTTIQKIRAFVLLCEKESGSDFTQSLHELIKY